jgi:hypothetical protein
MQEKYKYSELTEKIVGYGDRIAHQLWRKELAG